MASASIAEGTLMPDATHQSFTVSSTAYLRNLDLDDLQADCVAVHHQVAPTETENGRTIGLRFPFLLVTHYFAEQQEIADAVARILNAHWDEQSSLVASARALRDAGLLGQADYQRTINRIEARESVRRFKEIVA
jgi:hypothetical protein